MAAPQIQFSTVPYPGTRGKSARVMWSDDFGTTWHEPDEPCSPAVMVAWDRVKSKTAAVHAMAHAKRRGRRN